VKSEIVVTIIGEMIAGSSLTKWVNNGTKIPLKEAITNAKKSAKKYTKLI
jgi:hypothetical protein